MHRSIRAHGSARRSRGPWCISSRWRGRAARTKVADALDDVRLDESYQERFPDQLSGGERQRVAIARALAAKPALLLCDEILSALDVSVQANILTLLRQLKSEHGIAMLFISHDLAVVRMLADHVCVLYGGEVMEIGPREQVFAPPFHPYTHSLLHAVPVPLQPAGQIVEGAESRRAQARRGRLRLCRAMPMAGRRHLRDRAAALARRRGRPWAALPPHPGTTECARRLAADDTGRNCRMKITKIECFVLLVPDYRADACSSAQDDLVVKIHTDEGLVGIGETDTNPWVARAMIEAPGTHIMGLGLTEMLMGKDPTDVEGLWDKMYTGLRHDRAARPRHLRHGRARHGAVGSARQGGGQAVLAVAGRRRQQCDHAVRLVAAGRRRSRDLHAHPGRARG